MRLSKFFKSLRKSKENAGTSPTINVPPNKNFGVCETPLDAKYTPEQITTLGKREIFVFGSNLAGHHAGGAARVALNRFGAVWGQGEGLQGNSYAIPTMQGGVETIKPYVDRFIEFAEYEKALTFYVTKIGCGIAGYKVKDIAPLFRNAYNLPNVILPIEFAVYLEQENRSIHPQKLLDIYEAAHKERVKHIDSPIKVIGVGEGGCNAIGRIIERPCNFVEYAIITDNATTVNTSKVSYRFLLQDSDSCTVKEVHTQKEFEDYFANRNENVNLIHSILDDTIKQLIIVAGFGGGFGTHCTKWLATIAEKANIPVKIICTIPFDFEGQRKQQRALDAANSLIEEGIEVKIIKAEDLKQKYQNLTLFDCFSLLDEYVAETVNQICDELTESQVETKEDMISNPTILPGEITTHCYGMTRTFADIILSHNEEKKYTLPDQALSDLGEYMQRFSERGDNVAFLSVRILKDLLHDDPTIFSEGVLNTDRLRELIFQEKYIHSKADQAYVLYCKEKLMNLVIYLNEFRRYTRPEDLRRDLFENTDVLQFSACAPIHGFYYFEMGGATAMNYPVQFFVRAIRNLWPEIVSDGVLDAAKMRKLMFGNHDDAVSQFGLEGVIKRDYIVDSPCHPDVFVPKVMGTAPIYVKDAATGRYKRSCGEGKGPNSIPDWLEFQIAKQILEKDKSYKQIGNYYIPKYDNTLPVYGEYSGRIVFKTQAEKIKFIEDVNQGKNVWR